MHWHMDSWYDVMRITTIIFTLSQMVSGVLWARFRARGKHCRKHSGSERGTTNSVLTRHGTTSTETQPACRSEKRWNDVKMNDKKWGLFMLSLMKIGKSGKLFFEKVEFFILKWWNNLEMNDKKSGVVIVIVICPSWW